MVMFNETVGGRHTRYTALIHPLGPHLCPVIKAVIGIWELSVCLSLRILWGVFGARCEGGAVMEKQQGVDV